MIPSVLVFILGAIVGSFLNVVVFRYNTGLSPLRGRSKCFSCNAELRWLELLPVVSFLLQGRKCRHCKSRLSPQYPLVELLTATVFVLIYHATYNILHSAFFWVLASLLIAIAVYDIRHKIIPDGLVYGFITLALIGQFFVFQFSFFSLGTGIALAAAFAALWYFSRGAWMGLGDAKLVLGIGWLLPPGEGLTAVFVAFWAGALVGLALLFGNRKNVTLTSEVPFAPFLVLGTIAGMIYHLNFF